MNLKTLALILKGLRVSGSWSQCMRKKTERGLSMNRTVVGQASRLPLGRLAPESIEGETPAQAAGTAAPLRIRRFMVPSHAKKRMEALHEPRSSSRRKSQEA